MMWRFLAAFLISFPAAACIRGTGSDSFIQNKSAHLLGSAAVTAGAAWAADDVRAGVAAGVLVGALREIKKDRTPTQHCEYSSIAADLIGVGLGAWGAKNWIVTPRSIVYVREF